MADAEVARLREVLRGVAQHLAAVASAMEQHVEGRSNDAETAARLRHHVAAANELASSA